MKRILILAILFLLVGNLQAQDKVMDSLQNEVTNVSNNFERAKLYNAISNQYKYSDPSRMLEYGNRAFQLAEENKYTIEMGTAYLNIGTAHIILGDYEKALQYYLEAAKFYEEENDKG
jgi:tetratricopeptide (TPR) repeat protein